MGVQIKMASTNQLTERESMRNLTLSTLERKLIQNTLGANLASDVTQYGLRGKEASKNAFNNEEIKKAKEEEYQELIEKYKSIDVAGEPTYPSNADISYKIMNGLEHVMETSYLEDLAEGVNKFVLGLDFKLPDKLKGYIHAELIQKATEEKDGKLMINPDKLNEDEQTALGVYTNLREAYRLSAAKKVIDANYLGDIKKYLSSVMDKYNPKPEKKEKGEGEGK